MLKKGDQYVMPASREGKSPTFIMVTRVAKDGTWADIRCLNWAVAWSKRMRLENGELPFVPRMAQKRDWSWHDVLDYVPPSDTDAKAVN